MSLFGGLNASQQQQKPSLFGSLDTTATTQPAGQSGGLFGSLNAQPQQQQPASTSLFGSLPNAQQSSQQPASTGLFGSLSTNQQPQQTSSLFGSTAQKPPPTSLFGNTAQPQQQQQQQTNSLFGLPQQQQQSTSLFGQPQQQNQSRGLFGTLGGSTIQQQQQHQQQQQQNAQHQTLALSQQQQEQFPPLSSASVWQPRQSVGFRDKTIKDQVELLAMKWLPDLGAKETSFQTYFYNNVPEDQIPYYVPGPQDDEKRWEEALQKKPSETSIPVLARGFRQIGERLRSQHQAAVALQQRLHQINESLSLRLQKHDTETTIAAAKARQRHQVLSRRCLALATKVQVLRNRGYALDRTEEELRTKLAELEKQASDPVLMSRQEEIWARMTIIRDRADLLEKEMKGFGGQVDASQDAVLDEEGMKTIKKILSDYDSQMAHLNKEVGLVQKDFEEWETGARPTQKATR